MLPRVGCKSAKVLKLKRSQPPSALYTSFRNLKGDVVSDGEDPPHISNNDFILSILRANPSSRDTRSYLASFSPQPKPVLPPGADFNAHPTIPAQNHFEKSIIDPHEYPKPNPLVAEILNPVQRHTALVKLQGPFTDVQLDSISRGIVYLEKLGLISVIIVENHTVQRGEEGERNAMVEAVVRVVAFLERHGAKARPILESIVRLGPNADNSEGPEAHALTDDLVTLRSSLRAGEIPVVAPFALDSFCRSVRIDANDVTAALARGMSESISTSDSSSSITQESSTNVNLTPLRLMIINREGGVPSYARAGCPHLLINLDSEYTYIQQTFRPQWRETHPTALSNLALAKTCLSYMPSSSSAIMVSHRSSSSLIANLITNRPAVSASLPHALLQGGRKLTAHTPTLLRRGLPIQVLHHADEIDRPKMKVLLERSFGRTLNEQPFYERLQKCLDFVIIAGDYVGTAIVTKEAADDPTISPITYLDKFAVMPDNQGDGTVDFLWVALHDETYGLGLAFSANPNGGKQGQGEGQDLVWRSRADNPVNKWYYERSSGHLRIGQWVLFWCDAEMRLKNEQIHRGVNRLSYVEEWERGRMPLWSKIAMKVPSSWR